LDRHAIERAALELRLAEVDDADAAFAELLQDAEARDLDARLELLARVRVEDREPLLADAFFAQEHGVREREQRVLVGAALDQRAGKGAFAFGAAHLDRVEAEQLVAHRLELVELEQAFELAAEEIRGGVHRDRETSGMTTFYRVGPRSIPKGAADVTRPPAPGQADDTPTPRTERPIRVGAAIPGQPGANRSARSDSHLRA